MRRQSFLLSVLALVMLSVTLLGIPTPAHAQDDCESYTIFTDGSQSVSGWTSFPGVGTAATLNPPTGWESTDVFSLAGHTQIWAEIRVDDLPFTTLTSFAGQVNVIGTASTGSYNSPGELAILFTYYDSSDVLSAQDVFTPTVDRDGSWEAVTGAIGRTLSAGDYLIISVANTGGSGNEMATADYQGRDFVLCVDVGNTWQKPLTEADIYHPVRDGIFDISADSDPPVLSPNSNAVIALSDTVGDFVYSVSPGSVEWIRDPGTFNCADAGLSDLLGTCYLNIDPDGDEVEGTAIVSSINIGDAYLIEVLLTEDSTYVQYLVEDAPDYITLGMMIEAGCIIGKTLPLETLHIGGTIGVVTVGATFDNQGVSILENFPDVELLQNTTISIVDRLTEETDPGDACNAEPEFAECLGSNPRFLNNGDTWNIRGGTSVLFHEGNTGGVDLNPGGEIFTLMPLDPDTEYTLTAGGITIDFDNPDFPNMLLLHIGTAQDSFEIHFGTERVALEETEPGGESEAGYFEVGMKNLGNFVIHVGFLCVSEGGPPIVPNSCYFINHSFDLDSVGWTADTAVTFPGDGTAQLADSAFGNISQPVNLDTGDYTLSARVRPYYSVPADQVGTNGGDIDVNYTLDGSTDAIGSLVWGDEIRTFAVLSTTFTLSDPVTDSILFDFDMNSAPEEFLGLQVDYFCLEKDGGYTGGGGYPPPINPSCSVVANPDTTDVPSWISWQWAQFNRFFECQLIPLLLNIYTVVRTGIDTLLRVARYWIIVVQRYASWIGSDGIPWLNGHFNNIAFGRSTTIIETGDPGCHDIICLINNLLQNLINSVLGPLVDAVTRIVDILLDIFGRFAGILLDVISGLINLLFALFGLIVGFVIRMINYLGALVSGFNNATPTPLPGIPQCQLDPQGNAVCIGLWMLENTVFADEGQLYIPLLIGAMSIALLFWLVDTIRREISSLGDKL